MTTTFQLPDLGEGIAEGEVINWLVEVGDEVNEEDPLIEVETDKALVDIPAPMTGRVVELHVEEGDIVPVGIDLLTFEEAGEEADNGEKTASEPAADASSAESETAGGFARPSTRRLARELGVDLNQVSGSGPGGRITDEDVRAAANGEPPPSEPERTAEPESTAKSEDRGQTLATPATRQLASELGVDLDDVPASGERDGQPLVTTADVRTFAEGGEPAAVGEASEAERREPYRGIRRTIGETMAESWATIPHATHYDEVDANALVELRNDLKPVAEERDIRLTYLPFVMLAVARALQDHPVLNASLDTEAEEVVYKNDYHLGFATDTEAGLVVPVVKHADQKSLFELASEVTELGSSARDRSIDVEDFQGGTFTITNIGGIGGHYASPIINPPEVGILALGSISERPRVVHGEVVPRHVLPLSLAIDHRVVDGADAARFTNDVKSYLRQPVQLLVE